MLQGLIDPGKLMAMGRGSKPVLPEKVGDLIGASKLRPMSVGASNAARPVSAVSTKAPSPAAQEAQDLLNLGYLKDKLGVDINKLRNTQGIMTDSALTDAAILGGGALGITGIAGLGGADGGDALGMAALGAGTAAAPAIFNEVRNPSFRGPRRSGRDLVGMVAAGAGAGAGTSLILDALGVGGGRPESNNLMIRYV